MKYIKYIYITFVVLCVVSCTLEKSRDGDLDNFWYLTQIDDISTGEQYDNRSNQIFWSFQGSLLQFEKSGTGTYYVCSFQKDGNKIEQKQLYRYDRMNGDVLMDEDSIVKYNLSLYGITKPVNTYNVESLDGSNMVLNDGILRLHFESY